MGSEALMVDDDEEDMETARMDVVQWLPPVASKADLPDSGVQDGVMCFVHQSDSVWRFRNGRWNEVGKVPGG